jgi:hypothetical protein
VSRHSTRSLRNVTLLERPAPTLSVVSAVQAAVRGRERQYQMRDQFESIRKGEMRSRELLEQLEIAVDASELGTFHCEMPLDKNRMERPVQSPLLAARSFMRLRFNDIRRACCCLASGTSTHA